MKGIQGTKAHLHRRCDVDGARRALAFDTRAEEREDVPGAGAGVRRKDRKPGTKDGGKRQQQRFVDRKQKGEGEQHVLEQRGPAHSDHKRRAFHGHGVKRRHC